MNDRDGTGSDERGPLGLAMLIAARTGLLDEHARKTGFAAGGTSAVAKPTISAASNQRSFEKV